MKNILAIDVGYGHVKWVGITESGETKKGMFPSVAAITTRDRSGESNGMSNLRTVTVNVGEHNYVVGRDAYLETDAHFSRSRLNDYCQTPGYKALMLGAMVISGMREIDQLVVGLPMTTMSTYHEALRDQYKGEHVIGAANAKRKNLVAVENVTVTSQPAGAILHAASVNESLRKKTSLVIDVGYFTVDYLMCQGMRPVRYRAGIRCTWHGPGQQTRQRVGIDGRFRWKTLQPMKRFTSGGGFILKARFMPSAKMPRLRRYSEPCWRWRKKRRQSGQLLQTQPLLTRWKASFYQ
jgi:hypothetical protein